MSRKSCVIVLRVVMSLMDPNLAFFTLQQGRRFEPDVRSLEEGNAALQAKVRLSLPVRRLCSRRLR